MMLSLLTGAAVPSLTAACGHNVYAVKTQNTPATTITLNGVYISSATSAPLHIEQSENAVIGREANTENVTRPPRLNG